MGSVGTKKTINLSDIDMDTKIEIKEDNGVWRTYTRTVWGLSRDSIPGYQPPGYGMIMNKDLDKYKDRWRFPK